MKKICSIFLLLCLLFSFVGCEKEEDYSEFQGVWTYVHSESSPRIEYKIKITGATATMIFKGDHVGESVTASNLNLWKEDGKCYICFNDDWREISVSKDGKKLYYDGKTYTK